MLCVFHNPNKAPKHRPLAEEHDHVQSLRLVALFVHGYQFDSKSVTWNNHVNKVSWLLCCAWLEVHYYTPVVSDCEQMLVSVL
uniref:Uncharacterized protein n=1 Tax=Arundo donax TaxID=35708 RepID=A0A0A9D335_ARUDO